MLKKIPGGEFLKNDNTPSCYAYAHVIEMTVGARYVRAVGVDDLCDQGIHPGDEDGYGNYVMGTVFVTAIVGHLEGKREK
ncbi:MAG: hypothetical protein EG828_14185, partial [Deltaproteobacteria bacterium]|nr:hypothetical protein [Deltaproteobacteria bacterium]